MNCANHPEATATAFCRECGKPMCGECQCPAVGSVYCQDHVPAASPLMPPPLFPADPPRPSAGFSQSSYTSQTGPAAPRTYDSPYTAPVGTPVMTGPNPNVHPALALVLGFIPGVGAIYNGQYAKGLIHAVVFGLLISLTTSARSAGSEAFLGIMIAAWVFYQAFEAYHTARKRRFGMTVEEFSSLFDVRPVGGKFPIGAVLLIGLGFILLLDTTDIVRFDEFARYWPMGLILLGGYMLYTRLNPAAAVADNGDVR